MYECPRCGYSTKHKTNMKNHFKRKNLCECTNQEITIEECINMLEEGKLKKQSSKTNVSIVKNKKEYKCLHCSKKFDRKSRLDNHLEKCETKNSEFEMMKKQIAELQKQVAVNSSSTVNNTNSHNTTNNNINNTFNINLTAFKDTNYMAVKDRIMQCLENQDPKLKVPAFEKIIDAVHFDKENPENHNIYKPNVRDDRIMTFNGEEFIVDKLAIDTILEKLEEVIENSLDKETGHEYLKKLKNHLKLKATDGEYNEETRDDIALSLYNGRNIVKTTKSKLKK